MGAFNKCHGRRLMEAVSLITVTNSIKLMFADFGENTHNTVNKHQNIQRFPLIRLGRLEIHIHLFL